LVAEHSDVTVQRGVQVDDLMDHGRSTCLSRRL
jgi:hypothetical protein